MVATEKIELFEVQTQENGEWVLADGASNSITIPSNACNIMIHFYVAQGSTGNTTVQFMTSHDRQDWHHILSDKVHDANDLISLDNNGQHIQQYLGYRVSGGNGTVEQVRIYFGRSK